MISFYFLFFCGGFVVCGLPRLLRSLAMTAHTNSSLRELLATRGNLSMGYNYSLMEFFFFSVFVFVISGCGLLRFARNDEGG